MYMLAFLFLYIILFFERRRHHHHPGCIFGFSEYIATDLQNIYVCIFYVLL